MLFLAGVAIAAHRDMPPFSFSDTSGQIHTRAEWDGKRAVVLLFLTTDCPLSNGYVPELNRIKDAYASRGVVFYAVQGDATVAVEDVRKHVKDFAYAFPYLLDPKESLAASVGATTTPEAAVLSSGGELLYLGRIDNRVEDYGKQRVQTTEFDLRDTLDAILTGKPVPRTRTKAFGCAITLKNAATAPTYNKDIAPILYQNCATCHRPGEVAPFSLLTYQDTAKRAALIATVTKSRVMPPWKPEPGYGDFRDTRRLSEEQIAVIQQWASEGAPEGDPSSKPKPPTFTEGWQLGQPDKVVTVPAKFSVPADGPDRFRCFVIPLNLENDAYVSAMEFRPDNRRTVHHALVFTDPMQQGRKLAEGSPDGGYACFGGPGFIGGIIGGWAPGSVPAKPMEGYSTPLSKGTDLVIQIHYHPSGKPAQDQSSLGLFYGPPPTRGRTALIIGTRRIDIQPGDSHYTVKAEITLPSDAELLRITPHAHYLCKDMKLNAHLPDGSITPLVWIKDWDFSWQSGYTYTSPIKLSKGTRIEMEYTYDNSEANPRNPSHPPVRVTHGEQTTDEMGLAFLTFALPTPAEAEAFRRAAYFSRR